MHKTGNAAKLHGRHWSMTFGLCAILTMSVSTCGDKSDKKSPAPAGQVIAKVNGQEITVHELNYEFNHLPNIPENEKASVRQTLARQLVGQKLLEEKAIDNKLDHQPDVLLELERAKTGTLAKAFMGSKLAQIPDPAPADVEKYIAAHPEQFSQRQVIFLSQIQFPAASLIGDVKTFMETQNDKHEPNTLSVIANYLKAKNVAFKTNKTSGPIGSLPATVQSYVAKAPSQDIFVLQSGPYSVVNVVEERQSDPLVGDDAKTEARRVLHVQNQGKFIETLSKKLIADSKIEFMGEFKDMPIDPSVVAKTPALDKK